VNDLIKLLRKTGSLEPRPQGNDGGHGKLAPVSDWIEAPVAANPIEMTFSKLMALLKQAAARIQFRQIETPLSSVRTMSSSLEVRHEVDRRRHQSQFRPRHDRSRNLHCTMICRVSTLNLLHSLYR
jgi:hypothetical protein